MVKHLVCLFCYDFCEKRSVALLVNLVSYISSGRFFYGLTCKIEDL